MDAKHDHPLFRKKFISIEDWRTWQDVWNGTTHLEVLMGLLHVAFHVTRRGGPDRSECVDFLLKVADGWRDEGFLGSDGGNLEAARKALAGKSFGMLADEFFRRRQPGEHMEPAWLRDILADPLYFGLLRFLDDGERRGSIMRRNLSLDSPRTHQEICAREFTLDFIAKTWNLEDGARGIFYSSEEASRVTWQRHCAKARPRYVRILHGIGRLDLLTRLPMIEDSAEHRVLRDLALRNPYLEKETYASLDEALLKGWPAPRVLTVVEAIMRAQRKAR